MLFPKQNKNLSTIKKSSKYTYVSLYFPMCNLMFIPLQTRFICTYKHDYIYLVRSGDKIHIKTTK